MGSSKEGIVLITSSTAAQESCDASTAAQESCDAQRYWLCGCRWVTRAGGLLVVCRSAQVVTTTVQTTNMRVARVQNAGLG